MKVLFLYYEEIKNILVIEEVKCPEGRSNMCVHFGVTYCPEAPPCYRSGIL